MLQVSRKKTGNRTRQARPNVSAEGRYLSLYCRGTVTNPHEKWRIASFYPDIHEGDLFWSERRGWYAETAKGNLLPIAPTVTRWLDGNQFIPRDAASARVRNDADVDAPYRDSFRTSWELRCGVCRFKRTIGRPRDAYPLMNALSTPGIVEVPIREFVSRVGKVD